MSDEAAAGPPGLLLARRRSAVYAPQRETRSFPLPQVPPLCDLAAAVVAVLHRHHGVERIPLGVGGSQIAAIEVPVTGDDRLTELRDRIAEAIARAPAAVAPSTGHNPRFAVAITDAPPEADHREDVAITRAAGELVVRWSARLIAPETVERFVGHLGRVLAAGDPTVAELDLVPDVERAVIERFESGGPPVGSAVPVHLQVSMQAEATPDAVALAGCAGQVTYRELAARAGSLAAQLAREGVEPGEAVAMCVPPAYGPTALLGILWSGAGVVPLDGTFPAERLRVMMEQAGVRVAVVAQATRDRVPLERLVDVERDGASAAPPSVVDPGATAYLLFTSGSTGIPKGIRMPHRALANLVGWQRARSTALRTLHRTSLAFDVGVQEVFATLCAGGSLVIADDELRADPSRLPAFLAEYAVERIFVPPVSLHEIAAALDASPRPLPALREVYVAGETLHVTPAVVRMFRAVDATLENQYGPTETHVATTYRLEGSALRWPALPPIGRPVPGLRVSVRDRRGRRVPIGVPGELVVRGVQVADGYLAADGGFSHDSEGVAYTTGDLARWRSDGELEFLGRSDDQVKVRGYRIELGEVQRALLAHPDIRAAHVAALGDPSGARRLVAWLVPARQTLSLEDVRAALLRRLPEHMVPALSALVQVDALPLTATGKVNPAALPPPGTDRPEMSERFVSSRNALEEAISEIWRRELRLERVGVNDEFLALGGQSLMAIRIASELSERYGVALPLRVLLRGGTVARVAERIDEYRRLAASPAGTPIAEVVEDRLDSVTLPDGRVVLAPYAPEVIYLWEDVFVEQTYGPPIEYPEDAVVVDVGANVGLYALYALDRAPRGRVVAIEPVPLLAQALARNTTASAHRLTCLDCAAAQEAGEVELTFYPLLSGMSSVRANPAADRALLDGILRNLRNRRAEVDEALARSGDLARERLSGSRTIRRPARTLQQILDETAPDRVDVLKVDVQRYEEAVLAGVGSAWPRIRQVVVEVHDEAGALERVTTLLGTHGYMVATRQASIHAGTPVHFVTGRR